MPGNSDAPPPVFDTATLADVELFRHHAREVASACDRALAQAAGASGSSDGPDSGEAFDGILFHAGAPLRYHGDDQNAPFRTSAHFGRWGPIPGPNHLLLYRPGARPRLVRVVPDDYWHGPPPAGPLDAVLGDVYDVVEAPSLERAVGELGEVGRLGGMARLAYLGNAPDFATAAGIPLRGCEPAALLAALDWERALKTDYEISCLRAAAQRAGRGHRVVRELAGQGASERVLHAAYLEATGQLDSETPYPNIIAWNEASAVLHYEARRSSAPRERRSLLIDAGASFHGYASDITRSYPQRDAHPVFRELLEGMEQLQLRLVDAVAPGSYVALHERAAREVSALLGDVGVLRVDAEQAIALEIDRSFFPHGVGHHLGLRVHDVGGQLAGPSGRSQPPPERAPSLRTTRELVERHVVTIEPGVYFIPSLLEALRAGPSGEHVDWALVSELVPCGGIRIEDDVVVTAAGAENLSRPFVPASTPA